MADEQKQAIPELPAPPAPRDIKDDLTYKAIQESVTSLEQSQSRLGPISGNLDDPTYQRALRLYQDLKEAIHFMGEDYRLRTCPPKIPPEPPQDSGAR